MTVAEFVQEIQGYYGPYPTGQRKYIAEYLSDKSPAYLKALFYAVVERVPSQYKTPPDLSVLREYHWFGQSAVEKEAREKLIESFKEPEEPVLQIPEPYYDVTKIIDDLRDRLKIPKEEKVDNTNHHRRNRVFVDHRRGDKV